MTSEFKKLIELEKLRKITIGLNRSHANNFWYRTTRVGKVLNLLTPLFTGIIVFGFIKFGLIMGMVSIILLGFYVVLIQKMAGLHVRPRLLKEEGLFDAAYKARSATIRDNDNGKIILFPADWRIAIRNTNALGI